jgi:hypothetical protein
MRFNAYIADLGFDSATDGSGAPRSDTPRDHASGPVHAVNLPESYPLCDFFLLIDPPEAFGSPCVAVEEHIAARRTKNVEFLSPRDMEHPGRKTASQVYRL